MFIAELIVRSTCFGHHYAHHQELKIYTDDCCLWYLALGSQVVGLVWGGAVGYVSRNIPQTEHITHSSIPHQTNDL